MTQVAGPDAVLGDFDGVRLEYFGRTFELERRGDEYWVNQVGGRSARVVQTTGSHHYQVYWVNSGRGNMLQNFPYVYLLDDQRWVRRNDVFMVPPEIGAEPEGVRPWNNGCLSCHATHGRPRVVDSSGFAATTVAELGISCEACHGPAEDHVRKYSHPAARYAGRLLANDDPLIVNPAKTAPKKSSEICGQCHAITAEVDQEGWNQRGFAFRPGDDLLDTRHVARHPANEQPSGRSGMTPERLDQYFWSDGMVRVSGREYTGLIESPCYQRGELSCLSCHSMLESDRNDQLAAGMSGDRACTQCHAEIAGDVSAHTHHPSGSSGSSCYNCHMPHTTYGLMKAIRSHQIDSPNVETTLQAGRPNACNLCHLDQPLAWTAEHLHAWYDQPRPYLNGEQSTTSAALLHLLQGDAGQRAIVAWHVGWEPALEASGCDWLAPFLAELLDDPYSVVRYIAHRSLQQLPGFQDFAYDYTADEAKRRAGVQEAKTRWAGEPTSKHHTPRTVLLDERGEVLAGRVHELLRTRDDRPVDLLE